MRVRSAQLRNLVVAASIAPLGAFYAFGSITSGASPTADPGTGTGRSRFARSFQGRRCITPSLRRAARSV